MSTNIEKVIIIGAGGFGREVYRYLQDLQKANSPVENLGFLDENKDALGGFSYIDHSVIGDTSFSEISKDASYICAIGNVDIREEIFDKIKSKGGRFLTLIHPSARIYPSCQIEEGAVICPGVILTDNVKIGKNVLLNVGAICGHDVEVGDHSVLCPAVNVTGKVCIGKKVFVGSSAVLTPGSCVGDNSSISAGSVVYKKWGKGSFLHGNPAKAMKKMSNSDV